jgi:hypothetical protein
MYGTIIHLQNYWYHASPWSASKLLNQEAENELTEYMEKKTMNSSNDFLEEDYMHARP